MQDEGVGRQLLDAAYDHACSNPASRGLLLATDNLRFADSLDKRGWLVHRTGTHGTVRGASCFLANTDFDEKLYTAEGELKLAAYKRVAPARLKRPAPH